LEHLLCDRSPNPTTKPSTFKSKYALHKPFETSKFNLSAMALFGSVHCHPQLILFFSFNQQTSFAEGKCSIRPRSMLWCTAIDELLVACLRQWRNLSGWVDYAVPNEDVDMNPRESYRRLKRRLFICLITD
jgi:hypothetical protein